MIPNYDPKQEMESVDSAFRKIIWTIIIAFLIIIGLLFALKLTFEDNDPEPINKSTNVTKPLDSFIWPMKQL